MTRRRCTSPPPPARFRTRRRGSSINNEDIDDDLRTIPDNHLDSGDDNSESADKPPHCPPECNGSVAIRRLFQVNTLKTDCSKSINSYAGVTPVSRTLGGLSFSEEDDKGQPAPLASRNALDCACNPMNSPANVYIYYRMDPNEASEQLVSSKA